jgi:hypothetical protein
LESAIPASGQPSCGGSGTRLRGIHTAGNLIGTRFTTGGFRWLPWYFFDSNILVYADDLSSGAKLTMARDLLEQHIGDGTAVVSLQVLQEYYAAATRKLGIPADLAQERVR